jgi:hypothetical protein
MHANEDLDFYVYRYDSSGGQRAFSSIPEDANTPSNWLSFNGWSTGPFDNPSLLPVFRDFEASDGSDHAINTTLETRTFGLSFGQHTPVLVDSGYVYFGTLGISGQEFVHLTISCGQDDVSWSIAVMDPEGRHMTSYGGINGDIWTIPFKPSIAGTYYVILQATTFSGNFAMFDILPEAIAPQVLPAGSVVSGELPTGEFIMRQDTGSWVHEEMAPTVHTYRVDSPTDIASLTYAFNYPQMFLPISQPPGIYFTSGEFFYDYDGGSRYVDGVPSPSVGEYFFRGGPYYVTVMGGDNIEYTLYHRTSSHGALPVNEKFQFENYIGARVSQGYTLDIEEPSVLRVNSTATGGELTIRLTGTFEDGFRNERTISFASDIENANNYLLPAGEYFVELDIAMSPINEWVKFNINPLTTETETGFMYVGGFQVESEVFNLYNLSLFLDTEDNVTVAFEMTIYDTSGAYIDGAGFSFANWWDGSSLMTHPSIANNFTYTVPWVDYYDGPVYVTLCAYEVLNNTQGATNEYMDYPVNVTIDWVNNHVNQYDVTTPMNVAVGADAHNFTLPLPGIASTLLWIDLNTTAGTWYNVSVMSGDASSLTAMLFSNYDGRTHRVSWGDLNDEYIGSVADFSFQFGAISNESAMQLIMSRNLAVDGFVWIEITPMVTHQLDVQQITPLGPDIFAVLGGIAFPAVIGVGVIIVVYIVYVKRFKK